MNHLLATVLLAATLASVIQAQDLHRPRRAALPERPPFDRVPRPRCSDGHNPLFERGDVVNCDNGDTDCPPGFGCEQIFHYSACCPVSPKARAIISRQQRLGDVKRDDPPESQVGPGRDATTEATEVVPPSPTASAATQAPYTPTPIQTKPKPSQAAPQKPPPSNKENLGKEIKSGPFKTQVSFRIHPSNDKHKPPIGEKAQKQQQQQEVHGEENPAPKQPSSSSKHAEENAPEAAADSSVSAASIRAKNFSTITVTYSCDRLPFKSVCEDTKLPSQFTLRWFMKNGKCCSYPYGHCKGDLINQEDAIRTKGDCEAICIRGESKTQTIKVESTSIPNERITTEGPGGVSHKGQVEPATSSCNRAPFKAICEDTKLPSQFTLRWYVKNGMCCSYPYGHCKGDLIKQEQSIRTKADCEALCLGKGQVAHQNSSGTAVEAFHVTTAVTSVTPVPSSPLPPQGYFQSTSAPESTTEAESEEVPEESLFHNSPSSISSSPNGYTVAEVVATALPSQTESQGYAASQYTPAVVNPYAPSAYSTASQAYPVPAQSSNSYDTKKPEVLTQKTVTVLPLEAVSILLTVSGNPRQTVTPNAARKPAPTHSIRPSANRNSSLVTASLPLTTTNSIEQLQTLEFSSAGSEDSFSEFLENATNPAILTTLPTSSEASELPVLSQETREPEILHATSLRPRQSSPTTIAGISSDQFFTTLEDLIPATGDGSLVISHQQPEQIQPESGLNSIEPQTVPSRVTGRPRVSVSSQQTSLTLTPETQTGNHPSSRRTPVQGLNPALPSTRSNVSFPLSGSGTEELELNPNLNPDLSTFELETLSTVSPQAGIDRTVAQIVPEIEEPTTPSMEVPEPGATSGTVRLEAIATKSTIAPFQAISVFQTFRTATSRNAVITVSNVDQVITQRPFSKQSLKHQTLPNNRTPPQNEVEATIAAQVFTDRPLVTLENERGFTEAFDINTNSRPVDELPTEPNTFEAVTRGNPESRPPVLGSSATNPSILFRSTTISALNTVEEQNNFPSNPALVVENQLLDTTPLLTLAPNGRQTRLQTVVKVQNTAIPVLRTNAQNVQTIYTVSPITSEFGILHNEPTNSTTIPPTLPTVSFGELQGQFVTGDEGEPNVPTASSVSEVSVVNDSNQPLISTRRFYNTGVNIRPGVTTVATQSPIIEASTVFPNDESEQQNIAKIGLQHLSNTLPPDHNRTRSPGQIAVVPPHDQLTEEQSQIREFGVPNNTTPDFETSDNALHQTVPTLNIGTIHKAGFTVSSTVSNNDMLDTKINPGPDETTVNQRQITRSSTISRAPRTTILSTAGLLPEVISGGDVIPFDKNGLFTQAPLRPKGTVTDRGDNPVVTLQTVESFQSVPTTRQTNSLIWSSTGSNSLRPQVRTSGTDNAVFEVTASVSTTVTASVQEFQTRFLTTAKGNELSADRQTQATATSTSISQQQASETGAASSASTTLAGTSISRGSSTLATSLQTRQQTQQKGLQQTQETQGVPTTATLYQTRWLTKASTVSATGTVRLVPVTAETIPLEALTLPTSTASEGPQESTSATTVASAIGNSAPPSQTPPSDVAPSSSSAPQQAVALAPPPNPYAA